MNSTDRGGVSSPENTNSAHPLNVAIGERVRRLRPGMGWSQQRLAETCGTFGPSQLGMLERGDRPWMPEHLAVVAAALEVDVADLVSDRTAARPAEPPLTPNERALLESYRAGGPKGALAALLPQLQNLPIPGTYPQPARGRPRGRKSPP